MTTSLSESVFKAIDDIIINSYIERVSKECKIDKTTLLKIWKNNDEPKNVTLKPTSTSTE